jgi:predicted DNA-binding antitoxin AbrB/MazE fold protein
MSVVRAYYNGSAFVPVEPVNMRTGEAVKLTIVQDIPKKAEIAKKLAAFRQLTEEIHKLNETEPLPPEYDEIMSRRVNFTRVLEL